MDELLKNLESYIAILNSCRTEQVTKWKLSDVERAVKWSKHFENVCKKLSNAKPHIQQQFTDKLTARCTANTSPVQHDKSSWLEFLKDSYEYLVKSLVENPFLSEELRDYLLSKQNCTANKSNSENDKLLESLSAITTAFSAIDMHIPAINADILISSLALTEEFKQTIKNGSSQMTGRLTSLATEERGLEAIIACLSHVPDHNAKRSDTHLIARVQQEILKWITADDHIRDKIIPSITPQFLAYISEKSSQFFDFYLNHLISSTDICTIDHSLTNYSTDTLVNCWKCLLYYTTQCMKGKCIKVIKDKASLSSPDSVWNKLYYNDIII